MIPINFLLPRATSTFLYRKLLRGRRQRNACSFLPGVMQLLTLRSCFMSAMRTCEYTYVERNDKIIIQRGCVLIIIIMPGELITGL
jgi:hypothetical protein